ncbi:MAG: ABC transporter ATP-binding protein, partial [bacterium]
MKKLSVQINSSDHSFFAIQDMSFAMQSGETLALVGESGSGKTMTALALLGLLPKNACISGEIWFEKRNLTQEGKHACERLRGAQIAMVFQEPAAALNPVIRVGVQITDVIKTHLKVSHKWAKRHTLELLGQVGLCHPNSVYRSYPHQLSGGMAQRVMIAMALSCTPKLIIADEPTTALDVTTQTQILKLITYLQKQRQFALLLISHDISVVAALADSIIVMRNGRMVEKGRASQLLSHPRAV